MNRLASMMYPLGPGQGSRRMVSFEYSEAAGDVDDRLSRVTGISVSGIVPKAAEYQYGGVHRRISAVLGGVILQTVAATAGAGGQSAVGYDGLDRFGRLTDLHYQIGGPGGPTLHRYEYGYDAAGNRTFARVTQEDHENDPGRAPSGEGSEAFGWKGRDACFESLSAYAMILERSLPLPGLVQRRILLEIDQPRRQTPLG